MNPILAIRKRLGLSQAAFAAGLGVSQGNVSFYERGQTMPPKVAARLIGFAKTLGHEVTLEEVYASELAAGESVSLDHPPASDDEPRAA